MNRNDTYKPSSTTPPAGSSGGKPMNRHAQGQGAAAVVITEPAAEVRALAVHPAPASPLDLPVEVFRSGLTRRKENRAALMEWVRAALVEGVDYGCIHSVGKTKCQFAAQGRASECPNPHHWSKPSLFKPGAEKICGMLGVTVHFPTLHDYEQAALHGVKLEQIIVRCEIHDAAGRVVADGVGARALAQDYGDINKALKMAEKSAHIDATLRMAGLSEVFTQDLEDMTHGKDVETQTKDAQGDRLPGPAPARTITEGQRQRLEARIEVLGVDRKRVLDWMCRATYGHITRFADLTPGLYARVFDKINQLAASVATAGTGAGT